MQMSTDYRRLVVCHTRNRKIQLASCVCVFEGTTCTHDHTTAVCQRNHTHKNPYKVGEKNQRQ